MGSCRVRTSAWSHARQHAPVLAQGYLPREYECLDSAYGSAAELRACIRALRAHGVAALADVVLNHRCAGEQVRRSDRTFRVYGLQFIAKGKPDAPASRSGAPTGRSRMQACMLSLLPTFQRGADLVDLSHAAGPTSPATRVLLACCRPNNPYSLTCITCVDIAILVHLLQVLSLCAGQCWWVRNPSHCCGDAVMQRMSPRAQSSRGCCQWES